MGLGGYRPGGTTRLLRPGFGGHDLRKPVSGVAFCEAGLRSGRPPAHQFLISIVKEPSSLGQVVENLEPIWFETRGVAALLTMRDQIKKILDLILRKRQRVARMRAR
jgi:hypothetical protein